MKYTQLVKAIDAASQQLLGRAATVVNQALVIRNWLVGAYIEEFEQNGEDRAKYGDRLLLRLANDLEKRTVSGLGLSMLKSTRNFYFLYPQIDQTASGFLGSGSPKVQKGQPPVGQSVCGFAQIPHPQVAEPTDLLPAGISAPVVRKSFAREITPLSARAVLHFSWTHILEFIRIEDPLKRSFYENECLKGIYLNLGKKNGMEQGDNPPVGVILCSHREKVEVEFATAGMDNRLFVSRYLVALPSAEQLRRFLETDRARVEAVMEQTAPARARKPASKVKAKKPSRRL